MTTYTPAELAAILARHAAWLRNEPGGQRANLCHADLNRADLHGADLHGADLRNTDLHAANLYGAILSRAILCYTNLTRAILCYTNLTRADLAGADLEGANLCGADLRGANLCRANLAGTNLYNADLHDANLAGTCLDPALHTAMRAFCAACPADAEGWRIVYRTARSQHIKTVEYLPGQSYDAPVMSWDSSTACHPGIYAGALDLVRQEYPTAALVRCRVRDGDWTITAKGCIRCTHLEVLDRVEVTAP